MYYAKIIEKMDNGPGYWNHINVGVYEKKTNAPVHSYKRNYPALFDTFFPFTHNQKWYALFSYDYTATAVMSLPDGKIVAEEPANGGGFCPVDFYIPRYCEYRITATPTEELKNYPEQNWPWLSKDRYEREYDDGSEYGEGRSFEEFSLKGDDSNPEFIWLPGLYYDLKFAFVAGCHWGDDSSWKVARLDLSNFLDGKIVRSHDYGYLELPNNQSLKEAIRICDSSNENTFRFKINNPIRFEYKDGIFKKENND